MNAPRIRELKREWAEVCNAMADGYWRGTDAEALAEIERIKAEIAELEKAMIDLIDRKALVAAMKRILDSIERSPDVSPSYRSGFKLALQEVEAAHRVKVAEAAE